MLVPPNQIERIPLRTEFPFSTVARVLETLESAQTIPAPEPPSAPIEIRWGTPVVVLDEGVAL